MNRRPPAPIPALGLCATASLLFAAPYLYVRAQPVGPDLCASDLKQLAFAVSSYTQDFNGALPPMGSATATAAAMAAYAPKPSVFDCPVTGKPYQPNATLSAVLLANLTHPSATDLFHDSVAHPDGLTTHLYADGHIAHLAAKPRAKAAAKPLHTKGGSR